MTENDAIVQARSLAIIDHFQKNPKEKFTPKMITTALHENINFVKKFLREAIDPSSGIPITQPYHGWYQYCEAKAVSALEKDVVGFENLWFHRPVHDGYMGEIVLFPEQPPESPGDRDKEGFPYIIKATGQRIDWVIHANGSESIYVISNGNSFSQDHMLHVLQMIEDWTAGQDGWVRVRAECHRDDERLCVFPECVTFQQSYGTLWKIYNHKNSIRREVVDRVPVRMKDSVEDFLTRKDPAKGREALREVRHLADAFEVAAKEQRIMNSNYRKLYSNQAKMDKRLERLERVPNGNAQVGGD